mmetsp:Transcript_28544/g.71748  ORF Transcript_28544/g.71748 Transcript_28544/m.71748 type:complete len:280 (+) Transcript_28544:1303-2142(+)
MLNVRAVFLHHAVGRDVAHGVHHWEALGPLDEGPFGSGPIAHVKVARSFLGDEFVVARDHADRHAQHARPLDRVLGIASGRIEEGQQPHQVPLDRNAVLRYRRLKACRIERLRFCDGNATDTVLAQLYDLLHHALHHRLVLNQPPNDMRRALADAVHVAVCLLAHYACRALHLGVERHVIDALVPGHLRIHCALQFLLFQNVILCRARHPQVAAQDERVQRVLWWLLPPRSHGREAQQVKLVEPLLVRGRFLLNDHLVHGERARLVATQHVHTSQVLDR